MLPQDQGVVLQLIPTDTEVFWVVVLLVGFLKLFSISYFCEFFLISVSRIKYVTDKVTKIICESYRRKCSLFMFLFFHSYVINKNYILSV